MMIMTAVDASWRENVLRREDRGGSWWYKSLGVIDADAIWNWAASDDMDRQLGFGDRQDQRMPTLMTGAAFMAGRKRRCRRVPAEHALAFVISTRRRLDHTFLALWKT